MKPVYHLGNYAQVKACERTRQETLNEAQLFHQFRT